MRKENLLFLLLLLTLPVIGQNTLQTPAQFLGYTLGEQFTPHDKIIRYVEYAVSQAPNRTKLIHYGTTYEGRPLVVLVIASPNNMNRLEEIRTNHLKSIGMMPGQANGTQPTIAWMSYNVHGNESVSSEAVMQVIYDLLDTQNTKTQGFLNNTVVLLDPCINPDGRERYVQWYKQVAAQPYNVSPYAREHMEPWPGGRTNHYLFDLNRDWAWMTQKETQQRIALYNQWMPHLHADFHEQSFENPYYFSPAAKPFHQEITPFQRKFQNIIGDYNRKYFDANSWLYFTRERFDLFYPSYGDTWPTFNGAIGMTYEQGGIRAGLGILREEGDTLTLKERIAHHYTASLATLEAVSSNSDEITREFVNYFKKTASTPPGEYKSYVFKAKGAEGRIQTFADYLNKQGIQYGYAGKGGNVSGYRYQTGKNESVKLEDNDLVISAYQPKAVLLKVLMEVNPTLEDSVTYDITSWALPYSFGLDAYALKERLAPASKSAQAAASASQPSTANNKPYAYLASWKSLPDLQLLAALLKNNVKVRYAEAPFETEGQLYPRGTMIITRTGNEPLGAAFDQLVSRSADSLKVKITPVTSGFVTTGSDFGSDRVHAVKAPRVALLSGQAISSLSFGEVWHYFEQQLGYPVTVLESAALPMIPLNQFDVLILPSGNYGSVINDRMLSSLKDWIRMGGKMIALESAVNFFADKPDFEIKHKKPDSKTNKAATVPRYDTIQTYANREREQLKEEVPGAIYRVTLDETHPLAFGYGNTYYALLRDPIDYELLPKSWNVGYLKRDSYVSGFAGSKAKEKLKDTFVLGVQDLGRGQMIYLNSSPLFRAFWQNGKLLFGNAVFLVGNN